MRSYYIAYELILDMTHNLLYIIINNLRSYYGLQNNHS